MVPEHDVKERLRALGVDVPRSVIVECDADVAAATTAAGLKPPLVLKAWGSGIVHKTDVGAVVLGLTREQVNAAAARVAAGLREQGVAPAGFLVEEQHPGGVELIVGVVQRPPFGPVVAFGLGGTLTEVVNRVSVRLWPVSAEDSDALIDETLGLRRHPPIDREALLRVVLAIAGPDGFAAEVGEELAELECNPVVVNADGATVLDARLVLHDEPPTAVGPAPPSTDFTRLFAPSSIAVVGASTTKVSFGNRFLAAYRDVGWSDGLYAIHPDAAEVDGVPAVRSAEDIDGGVDYVVVAVPASRCADVVQACRGNARFVHVISGGFGEAGPDGVALEMSLQRAAQTAWTSGRRVVGPNCMGVFSPAGRQSFQLGTPRVAGRVGVVSQSGGLAGDIVKAGDRRGIRFSKLVTVGNEVDVTAAELVEWLVDDADTDVIGLYLEGCRDGARLLHAFRRARGRTPIVVLPGGTSRQGAQAALSHTGAMTGDRDVWDAIAAATGLSVVGTLEELLAVLAFHQRHVTRTDVPDGPAVLVVGPGGGASVLATDACDRAGVAVEPVPPAIEAALRALGHGAGTSVANPIEMPLGPATSPLAVEHVLKAVLDGPAAYPDVLLHVNVQSYFSYSAPEEGAAALREFIDRVAAIECSTARLTLVLRNLDCAPAEVTEAVTSLAADRGLSAMRTLDEAAVAIAAGKRFHHTRT